MCGARSILQKIVISNKFDCCLIYFLKTMISNFRNDKINYERKQ